MPGDHMVHWRVGPYGEGDEEMERVCSYVRRQGWTTGGRRYGPEQWAEMLEHAKAGVFDIIVASFDGLVWVTAARPDIEFVRPRRVQSVWEPSAIIYGGAPVVYQCATVMAREFGPVTSSKVAEMLLREGWAEGSEIGVRGFVHRSLAASPYFTSLRGNVLRWAPPGVDLSLPTNEETAGHESEGERHLSRQSYNSVLDALVASLIKRRRERVRSGDWNSEKGEG